MSYEGKTSIVHKHAYTWLGHNYTTPIDQSQTSGFFYSAGRLALSNTFHFNWTKLQSRVNYANQQWVYSLQFDPTTNSNGVYLKEWDMYDTDGGTNAGSTTYTAPIIRWYPPYSQGKANVDSKIRTNFNHTTGNTNNMWLSLEY